MRKFTLLLSLLIMMFTTAKADFTQTYVKSDNGAFWGSAVTELPAGVTDVKPTNATNVYSPDFMVQVSNTGTVTVSFEHKTGNHGLNVLGVDLLNSAGTVVASSYAHKIAGGGANSGQKVYTMDNVENGIYTLRYFVCNIDGSDNVIQAGGDVVVTNAVLATAFPREAWSVTASSEETSGDPGQATNAIDGSEDTFWHTVYANNYPHWIEFDAKAPIKIYFFDYVSRFDNTTSNGNILNYKLYVSDEPMNGTYTDATLAAEGTFVYGSGKHHIIGLETPTRGQYIALVAESGTAGNWSANQAATAANCSEFNVYAVSNGNEVEKALLRAKLDECLAYYNAGLIGTHGGQYSTTLDFEAIYQAGENYYAAITVETEIEAINAEIAKIQELIGSFTRNMPVSGEVYTFQTADRGWLVANSSADYVWSSSKSGSGVTPATDNTQCQWVVYTTDRGKYMYNIAADKFIISGDNNALIPFGVIPNNSTIEFKYSTQSEYPYLIGFKNASVNINISNGDYTKGALLWGDGWTSSGNSGDPGSCMKMTYVKDADAEMLANIAKRVSAYEDAPFALTVSDAGYATLFLGFDAAIPTFDGEDNGVYIVKENGINENYIHLEPVTGVLPANTGVIVKANPGTYEFAYSAETKADVAGNLLKGSVADEYVEGAAYVLGVVDEKVGLYKALMTDGSWLNNANKAYLPATALTALQNTVAFYGFDWEGTTGIDQITDNREQSTVIYDLTGRRIEAITAPGIYVVNGKKVLVK